MHICVSNENEQVESKDDDVVIFVFPGSQSLAQCQTHYILTQHILLNESRKEQRGREGKGKVKKNERGLGEDHFISI